MQPHDDAAVALIQSPNVVVDFGADLLDADDHLIADLSPDLIDGKKDYQRDAQINNSCSIDILRPLDWKTARVRLWQSLSTGALTRRFNLGVFVLTTPVLNIGEDPVSYSVTGFDKMQLLIHMVGDTYVIPAGLAYLYAVRQVITDSGYTGLLPLFDGSAQEKVLAEPMVFLDPAQYSWLDIVNAVLKAIGYRTLYADENGRYRSEPDKIPALRPPEYVFKVGDMNVGIVNPDRTYTADSFEDLNEWIFIREGMATRPVEGAGIYTVDRSAGGIRKPKVVRFTAADQDSLVAQGNAQVADDTQSATTIQMTGGPIPFLGHLDVATISDGPIGDRKVIARSHTIQLNGDDTDMLWEVIDG